MEFKDCLKQIQGFLENSPLIILGSGSSVAYGLPSMEGLSEEIKKHADRFDVAEFEAFCTNLDSMGLEDAVGNALSNTSSDVLRKIVWECINKRDLEVMQGLSQNKSGFALADLLMFAIKSSTNSVAIVTTNYDRLAEYATDLIKATVVTGFEGNLIRYKEFPNDASKRKRMQIRERIVNIWKVHGFLDWFLKDGRSAVSFPLSESIPLNHEPLIIAPSKEKYSLAHSEPYRDVIASADMAFINAGSFICIGYGFNDKHIQPKLIEQIKNKKPVVVLCKTATEACKQNVICDDIKKFMIIEYHSEGKTQVFGNGYSEVYDGDFWQLPNFMETVLGVKNEYL